MRAVVQNEYILISVRTAFVREITSPVITGGGEKRIYLYQKDRCH